MSNICIIFCKWIAAMEPDDERCLGLMRPSKDIATEIHPHKNEVFQRLDCSLSEDIWCATSRRNKMRPAKPWKDSEHFILSDRKRKEKISSRKIRIMGCYVLRWSCCFLPGNIASNSISRSSGSSRWFIGSQRLSETKPNICIAMHIAVEQGHFQKRSGDVGACKSNDRSNAQAFFLSGFPGIQHILPRFVRFQSSFGAKKSCTCKVQIVIACSCFLVKREQGCHVTGIWLWSQEGILRVQKIWFCERM